MKDYQNKIIINDEEYYVRTEPVVINANIDSINVYTSYLDPAHDIAKISPADLKQMFEMGLPILYTNTESNITRQVTSASYIYDGDELTQMNLYDALGSNVMFIYFSEEEYEPPLN